MVAILKKFTPIQLWLFCIVISVVATEILVVGMETLLKGEITYDYLLTGFVASFLVAGFVVNFVIYFFSQKRKSDASLHSMQHRLDFLLKSTPAVMIYSACADGDFAASFISENVTRQLGYHPHEFIEDPAFWVEHIHPDDRTMVLDAKRLLQETGFHKIDYRFQHKDGNFLWMHDESMLIRDKDGRPQEFVGYWVNITEQKQAEENQRKSTEYLKRILDNLFCYVTLLDTNGAIQEVNNAPLQQSGMRREDALGQYFCDAPWWSYDATVRSQLLEAIAAAKRGETIRYDVPIKMGDDLIPIDFQIAPVRDENGKIVGLLPTGVDISARKKAEAALRRHKVVIDTARDGFCAIDVGGNLLEANQAYADMSGYSVEELESMHVSELCAIEDPSEVKIHVDKIFAQGFDLFETRHRRKDGTLFDVEVSVNYLADSRQFFAFFRDITERKKAEEELLIAATTFETHEAIMIIAKDGTVIRVNRAFERITGYSKEEVIGKNPLILSSGHHDKAFYAGFWRALQNTGTWSGEMWDRHKSGNIYPTHLTVTAVKSADGDTTQYVAMFADISERKKSEEEIYNLAFYDPLTGLPNRRLLFERLSVALSVSDQNKHYGALLFLDLDNFKTLNDTRGHEVGDRLLVEVADRLKSIVREVDTVARIGGDEFLVLLENISAEADVASQYVAQVAEQIRAILSAPYQIKNHTHFSSPSIGVRLFCGDEVSVDELVKHSDIAMYHAKDAGRNKVRFFDPQLQQLVETRATLESDLRRAITKQQLCLYYQIQLNRDLQPVGAEALIRWMHPKYGLVSPAQFIRVAEESSLILDIGNWVLDSACQQIVKWGNDEQTSSFVLAVNISAKQFMQADFVEQLAAVLRRHGTDASRLKLELTESIVLDDLESVIVKMRTLKQELGITLSLDDFGTGYSSLSYLKRLPLDQIKIDRSFVRDIMTNSSDAVMVKTIIDLAKNLGLEVIAEGVETDKHLSLLMQYGCMAYQGYLFGKPLPVEEFEARIQVMFSPSI